MFGIIENTHPMPRNETERANPVYMVCRRSSRQGCFSVFPRLPPNPLLQVIQRRPKAAPNAGQRAVVNNLAVAVAVEPISDDTAGGRHFAAASLRSLPPHPTRV